MTKTVAQKRAKVFNETVQVLFSLNLMTVLVRYWHGSFRILTFF